MATRTRSAPHREPEGVTERLLGGPARTAFSALSRLRGRRIFHPAGVAFEATLEAFGDGSDGGGLPLPSTGERPAVVRLSRAIGLPQALPDVIGLAIRLPDAHGPGAHQDLLLVTSGERPLERHLVVPAVRGFLGHRYTTLLPYEIGGRLRMIGLRPELPSRSGHALSDLRERAPGQAFELGLAPLIGGWEPVARLRIGEPLPDSVAENIDLDPWHTGGGLRPRGPLMGLRRPAYEGSRRGRGRGRGQRAHPVAGRSAQRDSAEAPIA